MMLTEIQDGDAIFSQAIAIASAEERAAYIAGACSNDAALRRHIEERVAAHFHAGNSNKPAHAAAAVAHANGHNHEHGSARHGEIPRHNHEQGGASHTEVNGHNREHGGVHHAEAHADFPRVMPQAGKAEETPRRGSTMTRTLLVLLAAAVVVSTSVAVWATRAEKQARVAERQADEERDQARKAVDEAKHQRDQALAARQSTAEQREQAMAAKKVALQSEQDTKAVLTFLEGNLLAAGHSKGWSGGPIKGITLQQAVDAAASKVAETFADRPLVEASVREILGSSYVDMEEAPQAVKQYERALALREALLGADNPDTGDCRNKLAVAYRLAGRTAEAGRLYDKNPVSPSHASALAVSGSMLLAQKKPAEAELKLRECLSIRQKLQPDDWTTFAAQAMLGEALLDQKKYADAEPLLLAGYEGLKQHQTKIPSQDKIRLTKGLERLVQLYEVWGKKDQAARWRKELETVEAPRRSSANPDG